MGLRLFKLFCVLFMTTQPLVTARESESCDAKQQFDGTKCSSTVTLPSDIIEENAENDSWFYGLVNGAIEHVLEIRDRLIKPTPSPYNMDNMFEEEFASRKDFMTDVMEQAKQMAAHLDPDINADMLDMINNIVTDTIDEIPVEEGAYLYPPLTRRHPGNVGDVNEIELEDGVQTQIITLSVNPPLFEIPDFLSEKHCDYIIEKATEQGLTKSKTFQSENKTLSGENHHAARVSESASLNAAGLGDDFIEYISERVSRLVDLPLEFVRWSEPINIGKYVKGGHYNAHLDSNEASRKIPCCFQTTCANTEGNVEHMDCCRICRYATVLYYLSDVEEGGETAFPLAGLNLRQVLDKDKHWANLTSNCYDAQVLVKPQKGKAIMWYNHFVDKNGYLGGVDKKSYHGGCDVIKGTKWISTNWISAPIYPHRYLPSKYHKTK